VEDGGEGVGGNDSQTEVGGWHVPGCRVRRYLISNSLLSTAENKELLADSKFPLSGLCCIMLALAASSPQRCCL